MKAMQVNYASLAMDPLDIVNKNISTALSFEFCAVLACTALIINCCFTFLTVQTKAWV